MLLLPLVEGLGQVCHALVCRKKPGDEVFTQSEASLCTRPGMVRIVVVVVVVVVALFNVFKRPNGCIGRPSLCPDRPSYIERR